MAIAVVTVKTRRVISRTVSGLYCNAGVLCQTLRDATEQSLVWKKLWPVFIVHNELSFPMSTFVNGCKRSDRC